MYFDDTPYEIQDAGKPYSFTQTGETYRFEVHSGDHWRPGDTNERSEISSKEKLQYGHTYTMTYDALNRVSTVKELQDAGGRRREILPV